ncbi:hypothetical protein T484DRAFT_1807448, partial [Baffinella frigidus]
MPRSRRTVARTISIRTARLSAVTVLGGGGSQEGDRGTGASPTAFWKRHPITFHASLLCLIRTSMGSGLATKESEADREFMPAEGGSKGDCRIDFAASVFLGSLLKVGALKWSPGALKRTPGRVEGFKTSAKGTAGGNDEISRRELPPDGRLDAPRNTQHSGVRHHVAASLKLRVKDSSAKAVAPPPACVFERLAPGVPSDNEHSAAEEGPARRESLHARSGGEEKQEEEEEEEEEEVVVEEVVVVEAEGASS